MKQAFILLLSSLMANSIAIAHTEKTPLQLPTVQRHCAPDDLTITEAGDPVSSTCQWQQDDSNKISVTLHVDKPVHFVMARCTFTPVSTDKVASIMASKSGNDDGSPTPRDIAAGYQIIDDQQIQFIVRNFNTVFDDNKNQLSHVNVLFNLNTQQFTPGDSITCTFSPVKFS